MRKEKLYLAGSLFSEAEINQRLKEGNMLESMTAYEVFNPITAPCNDKEKLPSASDIFWGDTAEVLESKCIVADISNNDVGVACELGIAWACNYLHYLVDGGYSLQDILSIMKKKYVYAHLSDIRKNTFVRVVRLAFPSKRTLVQKGLLKENASAFMIPIGWIKRWCDVLFKGKIKKVKSISGKKEVNEEKLQKRREVLEDYKFIKKDDKQ